MLILEVQRIMVRCYCHIRATFLQLICSKGAPECHRSDEFLEQSKLTVKPLIDVWSFGGVCSEAAVWVVLGMSELIRYRSRRQQEIFKKGTRQDGSCFHDGEKVLKTVKAMHNRLLKGGEIRPSDYITIPVLDQMVTSMLEEDPDRRQNAIRLWKRSQKILRKAQSMLKRPTQSKTLPQEDSIVNKGQFSGMKIPETRLPISPGAAKLYNGHSHGQGPPPHDPQYSPDLQIPERPSYVQHVQGRRSDTRHEHSTISDIAPGPLYRNSSFTSDKVSRRSSPITPHTSPMVNTKAAESPVQEKRPEKPYLSYMDAKKIRERRSVLPSQARDLLNDLRDRDHVSCYFTIFASPLLI